MCLLHLYQPQFSNLKGCLFVYNFQKDEKLVVGDFINFQFNQTNSFTSDIAYILNQTVEFLMKKAG